MPARSWPRGLCQPHIPAPQPQALPHARPLGICLCRTLPRACFPFFPSDLRAITRCLSSQASQFLCSGVSPPVLYPGWHFGSQPLFTGILNQGVWREGMCGLLEVQSSPESCELRSQRRLNTAMSRDGRIRLWAPQTVGSENRCALRTPLAGRKDLEGLWG